MINPISRLHPSSPDPVITKEVKKLHYDQGALPRFAHLAYITDFINDEILPVVNALSASGYQGLIDAANICPIGLKNWYWLVDTGGVIPGGGPTVESGDQLICTTDNPVAGDWAACGANFMIVEKNISPASIVNALTFDTSDADTRPGMKITGGVITAADAGADASLQFNSKGDGDLVFRSGTGNLDISSNSASVTAYFDAQVNTATTIQVRGQNSMSVDLVTPTSSATFKGLVKVTDGAGTGAGTITAIAGQDITVTAGPTTGAGNGGKTTITGGTSAMNAAGGLDLLGGNGYTNGGTIAIRAGSSTFSGLGGAINIYSGNSTGVNAGPDITIEPGDAGTQGTGGSVIMSSGDGGSAVGAGGAVALTAGNGQSGGGDINITPGQTLGVGVNGAINLNGAGLLCNVNAGAVTGTFPALRYTGVELALGHVDGNKVRHLARVTYDFAEFGGTLGAKNLGVFLPDNAIVTRNWFDVITAPVSSGAPGSSTIEFGYAGATQVFLVQTLENDAMFTLNAISTGAQDGTIVLFHKLNGYKEISMTIGSTTLTAGKIVMFLEYVISD